LNPTQRSRFVRLGDLIFADPFQATGGRYLPTSIRSEWV
jgi:hypothetical protein